MTNQLTAIERATQDVAIRDIEKDVQVAETEAKSIVIRDQQSLTEANQMCAGLKGLLKKIDETFKPIYDSQKASLQTTKEKWEGHRAPVKAQFDRIKGEIGTFLDDQERIRKEAEHKAWLAEQERLRAEAEKIRAEEEALAKAEAAQEAGDKEAADRYMAEAIEKGEGLEETISKAEETLSVPPPPPPVVQGFSSRTIWDIEIVDETLVPREYMVVDHVAIRKVVNASKGKVKIPGVKNIEKTIRSQRG